MDYKKVENYQKNRVKPEIAKREVAILEEMENKGGHTIMCHVGLTDEELRDRIAVEKLAIASTFYDKKDAEKYLTAILRDEYNQLDIAEWLLSNANFSDLTIYLPEDFDEYTGKGYTISGKFVMLNSAVAVLHKWVDRNGEVQWKIKTVYPVEY